ncbi:MAG TPA: 2-phosphosulfolactate phosphatase [Planctomycetota bacterium]|nr:2-phosphosulfolactate phosphatase [Planctomycetota bacterium]
MRRAEVYLHRNMVPYGGLGGHTAVVFDVLRASTTAAAALEAGAEFVIPFADIAEMRDFRERLPAAAAARCLLAGERGGLAAPGFDLGNSPGEFTRQRVRGRIVLFSTTNGTDALARAAEANRLLFGALLNTGALARELLKTARREHEELALVCAGTELSASLEDILAAGLLLDRLGARGGEWELDDGARVALAVAAEWKGREREAMSLAVGGRNVAKLGMEADIEFASRVDSLDLVPELVPGSGEFAGVEVLVPAGRAAAPGAAGGPAPAAPKVAPAEAPASDGKPRRNPKSPKDRKVRRG